MWAATALLVALLAAQGARAANFETTTVEGEHAITSSWAGITPGLCGSLT